MAKGNFEVGDEVMVRGAVTAVWPDGQITVQIAGAGHKVTLGGDSGYIVAAERPEALRQAGATRVECASLERLARLDNGGSASSPRRTLRAGNRAPQPAAC